MRNLTKPCINLSEYWTSMVIMVMDGITSLPSNLHQRPLLHNGHFFWRTALSYMLTLVEISLRWVSSTTTTFFCPQGGHCGEVQLCILCSWSTIAKENCRGDEAGWVNSTFTQIRNGISVMKKQRSRIRTCKLWYIDFVCHMHTLFIGSHYDSWRRIMMLSIY